MWYFIDKYRINLNAVSFYMKVQDGADWCVQFAFIGPATEYDHNCLYAIFESEDRVDDEIDRLDEALDKSGKVL